MAKAAKKSNLIDHIGKNAALLSIIEIGLGSLLHSFKIPFTGHTLSLNQGFILGRASLKARHHQNARFVGCSIANVTALLKSLSPAGKKLTPMLAISAQGFCFSVGTVVFGVNPIGIWFGMSLLSLWAFVQPVLLYYLLYGKTMIHIAEYFYEKLTKTFQFEHETLLLILFNVIAVKLVLAALVTFAIFWLPEDFIEKKYRRLIGLAKKSGRWQRQLQADKPKLSFTRNALLALRDLFNPLFVLSLLVTAAFFVFVDTSATKLIWALLRPIAVGYLLFLIIRIVPFEKFFTEKEDNFSRSMQVALKTIKGF